MEAAKLLQTCTCVVNPAGGLHEQSWRGQLKEFEAKLAASTAQWKLVVGHHPVYSSGGLHGDTAELQQYVEPLLRKYRVQVRLSFAYCD